MPGGGGDQLRGAGAAGPDHLGPGTQMVVWNEFRNTEIDCHYKRKSILYQNPGRNLTILFSVFCISYLSFGFHSLVENRIKWLTRQDSERIYKKYKKSQSLQEKCRLKIVSVCQNTEWYNYTKIRTGRPVLCLSNISLDPQTWFYLKKVIQILLPLYKK